MQNIGIQNGEMAAEYRIAAAKLSFKIQEHEKKQDMSEHDLRIMRKMLDDTRAVLRTISGYYDLPRPGELDSSSWRATGRRTDDG